MLHLAVFTCLQSAAYVTVGADRPYPAFSSISSVGNILNPDWYAAEPVIPDSKPNLGFDAQDKTLPFLKNSSVSSKPSELSFSKWSSQKCRKVPTIIERFSNNFVERVKACEKLREAFQIRGFSAKSLSSLYYKMVFESISSVGGLDAPVSARVVSDAVSANFDKLQKDTVIRIYGDSVGSYLFYRGYLSPSNVASLSQEYFKFNERTVNAVKDPTPEENFRAIGSAFVQFLSSLGLFNPYSTVMVSGFFVLPFYEV